MPSAPTVFASRLDSELPPKPWQQILSSRALGWVVSECGSGHLFYQNAREGRINPPPLLPESTQGSELLWVETAQGPVSLFAAGRQIALHRPLSPQRCPVGKSR